MSASQLAPETGSSQTPETPDAGSESQGQDWVLLLERFGLVGIFLIEVVAFSVLAPQTFPTAANWQAMAVSQAVTAVIAFALIIPLIGGRFDISVGANLGLCMIVAGEVMAKAGLPLTVAIGAAVLTGTLIGVANGVIVAYLGVNSIVATLGSSTIIAGIVQLVTGGVPIVDGISGRLIGLGADTILGIPTLFLIMVVIAIIVWYAHTQTRWGRNLVAVGSNADAAKLVGLDVRRIVLGSFVVSGMLAGVAGVLEVANLGSADPSIGGIPLILPALAAAFLGSTAFTPGQYNIPGTFLGIFFVAAMVSGMALLGAQVWTEAVLEGAIVIVAVAFSQYMRRRRTGEQQVGA